MNSTENKTENTHGPTTGQQPDGQHPDGQQIEASFSVLVMSLASNTLMNLGLAPDPSTNQTEKNLGMAKFNIDLLTVLREKTQNNLSHDEKGFFESVLADLQMKFVQANSAQK